MKLLRATGADGIAAEMRRIRRTLAAAGALGVAAAACAVAGTMLQGHSRASEVRYVGSLVGIPIPKSLPTGIASYGNPPPYSYALPDDLKKVMESRHGTVWLPPLTAERTKEVAGIVRLNAPVRTAYNVLEKDAKANPLVNPKSRLPVYSTGNPGRLFSVQLNATVDASEHGKGSRYFSQCVLEVDPVKQDISVMTSTWNDAVSPEKGGLELALGKGDATVRMDRRAATFNLTLSGPMHYDVPVLIGLFIRAGMESHGAYRGYPTVTYGYVVMKGTGNTKPLENGSLSIVLPKKADAAQIVVDQADDAELVFAGGYGGYSVMFGKHGLDANLVLEELKSGRFRNFKETVSFGNGTQEGALNVHEKMLANGSVHATVGKPNPEVFMPRR